MRRKWLITAAVLFFILVGSILLPKNNEIRMPNGDRIIVRRSANPFWKEGSVSVYRNQEKLCSLWRDFFDGPLLIYPFDDGQRFLCDYDYDTAILVFVVDLNAGNTNLPGPSAWNEDLKTFIARAATNVVIENKGIVRLPTETELQEVSDRLDGKNQHGSPGIYCAHFAKRDLLLDLATNRSSYWPLPGQKN